MYRFWSRMRAIRAPTGEPGRNCRVLPGPLVSWEEVEDSIPKRKICYRFALGISCGPKGSSFVLDRISPRYYQHIERQRPKASSPCNDPPTLKHVGRDLAALRITCDEDRSQRPSVTRGGGDGDRPPAGDDVDTDTESIDDEENSNDSLLREPTFHQRCALGAVRSFDPPVRGNPGNHT